MGQCCCRLHDYCADSRIRYTLQCYLDRIDETFSCLDVDATDSAARIRSGFVAFAVAAAEGDGGW